MGKIYKTPANLNQKFISSIAASLDIMEQNNNKRDATHNTLSFVNFFLIFFFYHLQIYVSLCAHLIWAYALRFYKLLSLHVFVKLWAFIGEEIIYI